MHAEMFAENLKGGEALKSLSPPFSKTAERLSARGSLRKMLCLETPMKAL